MFKYNGNTATENEMTKRTEERMVAEKLTRWIIFHRNKSVDVIQLIFVAAGHHFTETYIYNCAKDIMALANSQSELKFGYNFINK